MSKLLSMTGQAPVSAAIPASPGRLRLGSIRRSESAADPLDGDRRTQMDRQSSQITGDRHVTVIHGPGSVEHFYHFLLGFFVPIVYHLSVELANEQINRLIIRSCGPLDALIRELGDGRIEIIDKDRHRRMVENAQHRSSSFAQVLTTTAASVQFVTIHGSDYPIAYNKRKFEAVREVLLSIDAFRREIQEVTHQWPPGDVRILLIQRGPSPAFYATERSEVTGSGQQRRSVANHEVLYRMLRQVHPGCLNVMAENLTLARQLALFWLADIIVAQHGAALANIIWARPRTSVIEIFPSTLRQDQKDNDFFFNLSRCMGLRYRRVHQDHDHSDVDVERIRGVIATLIAVPEHWAVQRVRSVSFLIARPAISIKQWLRSFVRRVRGKLQNLRDRARRD